MPDTDEEYGLGHQRRTVIAHGSVSVCPTETDVTKMCWLHHPRDDDTDPPALVARGKLEDELNIS